MNDCQKAVVFMLNDYTVLHLNLVAKIAINASGEETKKIQLVSLIQLHRPNLKAWVPCASVNYYSLFLHFAWSFSCRSAALYQCATCAKPLCGHVQKYKFSEKYSPLVKRLP